MNQLAPYMLAIKLGVVALLLGGLTLWHYSEVRTARKEGHAAAVSERAAADLAATVTRTIENDVLAVQQRATNTDITKAKNEELAPVVARIAAGRLRRPKAICDSPARPAEAPSAASSNSPDSGSRLLSEQVDRDIRALILETEEAAATGRACQAFLRANELTP